MRIVENGLCVVMVLAALLACGQAFAAEKPVLAVGKEAGARYGTIQAAVDAAPEGAIVRVGPGEFGEAVTIRRPVTLEGAGWERTTILAPQLSSEEMERAMDEMRSQAAKTSTSQDRAAAMRELRVKLGGTAIRVEDAQGVQVRGIRLAGVPGNAKAGRLRPQGLLVLERAGAVIRQCAIVGSPGCGVLVLDGSQAEIRESLVAGMWNTGVMVGERDHPKTRVTLADCDVRNCFYAGIVIAAGQQVTIERCRISGAAWHGIRYDDASPTIEGNRIFANARSGIYASGRTAAVVKDNLFTRNEMNGMSCWFDNDDTIAGNTFAANLREGLGVLGASKPVVERNIFQGHPAAIVCGAIQDKRTGSGQMGNPQLRQNVFWKNDVKVKHMGPDATTSRPATLEADAGVETDPGFTDAQRADFSLPAASAARQKDAGVAKPLAEAGPWPIQPEEKAIIPDGAGRDSRLWKSEE